MRYAHCYHVVNEEFRYPMFLLGKEASESYWKVKARLPVDGWSKLDFHTESTVKEFPRRDETLPRSCSPELHVQLVPIEVTLVPIEVILEANLMMVSDLSSPTRLTDVEPALIEPG